MTEMLHNAISDKELSVLSSIVHIGEAASKDLFEDKYHIFGHLYFSNIRGYVRTKLVQMQCEIESHNSNFPFTFVHRNFPYSHHIPELRTKKLILHIARSQAHDILPSKARYKSVLSNNNTLLNRQTYLDFGNTPPISLEPFYGLLVFGGREQSFATIQFPTPGYNSIADQIDIPMVEIEAKSDTKTFERKKAGLKKAFLAQEVLS